MKAFTKLGKVEIILVILFLLNLLIPTSFPFIFNGIPLNKKPEAAVFIFFSGFFLLYLFNRYIGYVFKFDNTKGENEEKEKKEKKVIKYLTYIFLVQIILGVILLIFKIANPISNNFKACFILPEVTARSHHHGLHHSHPIPYKANCVFSTELPRQPGDFSRYEEDISFGPSKSWRLGILNDLIFCIYGIKENELPAHNQVLFRKNNSNPFNADFALSDQLKNRLINESKIEKTASAEKTAGGETGASETIYFRIKYIGQVQIASMLGAFTTTPKILDFEASTKKLDNILFHYQNYTCGKIDEKECLKKMSMTSLTQKDTLFEVSYSFDSTSNKANRIYKYLTTREVYSATNPKLVLALRIVEKIFFAFYGLYLGYILLSFTINIASNVFRKIKPILKIKSTITVVKIIFITSFLIAAYFYKIDSRVLHPLFNFLYYKSICLIILSLTPLLFASVRGVIFDLFKKYTSSLIFVPSIVLLLFYLSVANKIMPRFDQVYLLNPGDDAQTYASWGKLFLEILSPCVFYGMAFTKPFFIYFRGASYFIFGDGDFYFQIFMMMMAFLPICVLPQLIAVITSVILPKQSEQIRINSISNLNSNFNLFQTQTIVTSLTIIIASMCFLIPYLTYSFTWIMFLFSEGIAWICAIYALVMLLPLSAYHHLDHIYKNHSKMISLILGIMFSLVFVSRTNTFSLFLFFIGIFVLIFDRKYIIKNIFYFLLPIVLSIVIIFLHSFLDLNIYNSLNKYINQNSSVSTEHFSFLSIFHSNNSFFPDLPSKVITILSIIYLIYLFVIFRIKKQLNKGLIFKFIFLAITSYLGGFLFQIMFLDNAYYPRTIITSFYFLGFSLIFISLWSLKELRACK
ncbi:MAG: hypothetical protein HQK51_15715 [Oligoflexia bacterium]|nr:hypothetical protein [Oligoflexia bacterium]